MDKLSFIALDGASLYIRSVGGTDIFPHRFELEAVEHSWGWIRHELTPRDLAGGISGAERRSLVPKPGGGFRVATQLDPIETLTVTNANKVGGDSKDAQESQPTATVAEWFCKCGYL